MNKYVAPEPTIFSQIPYPQPEMQSSTVILQIPEVNGGNSTTAHIIFHGDQDQVSIELGQWETEDLDSQNNAKSYWAHYGYLTDVGAASMKRHIHKSCTGKFEITATTDTAEQGAAANP